MTVTSYYSSGKVMHYNKISSLVFTGAELKRRGDRYDLTLSIQGYIDYDSCWFDIRFYEVGGRMITEETVIEGGPESEL